MYADNGMHLYRLNRIGEITANKPTKPLLSAYSAHLVLAQLIPKRALADFQKFGCAAFVAMRNLQSLGNQSPLQGFYGAW